ncbi:MAG TPA: hypothetical protein VF101_04330 [Gaiellaceae bacterium]
MLALAAALLARGETDLAWWLSWFARISWFGCAAVTASRGKWGVVAIDVFVGLFSHVTAIRLAKPRSPWARKRYGPEKMHLSLLRYGDHPSTLYQAIAQLKR